MSNKYNVKYVQTEDEDGQRYVGALIENKMAGFLRYKLDNGRAWLYFVGVQREYRHLKDEQIGSNLMHIFENKCAMYNIWGLEGKYYPKGEEGSVVKRFYERNGYAIEREDYDLIVYKSRPRKTELNFEVENIDYNTFDKYFSEYLNSEEDERE